MCLEEWETVAPRSRAYILHYIAKFRDAASSDFASSWLWTITSLRQGSDCRKQTFSLREAKKKNKKQTAPHKRIWKR